MANGVYHTAYDIEINLTKPDLGCPGFPELLREITAPIDQRERELLQCLEHHREGVCQSEEDGRSPWMTIRRRTVDNVTTWVAAHLPVRGVPTPDESDKHKAMKERIARVAEQHGLRAEVEARATDGRIRTDVLVTGEAGRIGWEAQYSPISAETVRRRSRAAADHEIVPLWVTNSTASAVIERAPWARVDDFSWKEIASATAMIVRGGVRHLQQWKCLRSSERACPVNGSFCGLFHAQWHLAALCLPAKPPTDVDTLVVASADGELVPVRVAGGQRDSRAVSRMWVPARDRDRWYDMYGDPGEEAADVQQPPDKDITYTHQELDPVCRYGDESFVPRNSPRPRRDTSAGAGLRTFAEVPHRLFTVPRQDHRLDATEVQRRAAALTQGCMPWQIGPCAGCGTPINRYGDGGVHACDTCRVKIPRR
ncbi:competence protein CoiA family protein [Kitasatospora sp. NPDC004272]